MEQSTFFMNQYLLSWSRNSTPFMEPEGSLPRSQQPATSHYPEPDESGPHPHSPFLCDPLSDILPSTFISSIQDF
jgi:hypothetical protein